MKTKILFILIIIFTPLLVNISYSDCDPNEGWSSMTRIISFNGCQIQYTFCYRISNNLLHEIKIDDIRFLNCDCSIYEQFKNQINDKIIEDIASQIEKDIIFPELNIPECPDEECLLRVNDAICYNGCEFDPFTNSWKLNKCDNEIRSCNEATYFCWEWVNGQQVLRITRRGYMTGPPCNWPCQLNCNF